MRYRSRRRYKFRRGGRTRFVAFIVLIAVACAAAVFLPYYFTHRETFSCRKSPMAPEAKPTAAADFVANMGPSATPEPEQSSGAGESSQGTEGAAFVGNSTIGDLYVSGYLEDADFYYRIGLTVRDAFEKTMEGGSVPVIEELQGHDYSEVFLMFGQNELGWGTPQIFFDEYARIIQTVHEYCPNATVYVMSIHPMSKAASDLNENGANQEQVKIFNEQLKETARDNDAVYLDFTSSLQDATGYLPEEASTDGVHLNQEYEKKLADMILNKEDYIVSS